MLQEAQSYSSSYGRVTRVREMCVLTSKVTSFPGPVTAPTCWLRMARSRDVLTVFHPPIVHAPWALKLCSPSGPGVERSGLLRNFVLPQIEAQRVPPPGITLYTARGGSGCGLSCMQKKRPSSWVLDGGRLYKVIPCIWAQESSPRPSSFGIISDFIL